MAKFLSSTGILTKVKAKQTNNLLFESNWNDVQLKFGVIEEHSAIIVAVDDSDSVVVSKRFSVYTVETNEEKRDIGISSEPVGLQDSQSAGETSSIGTTLQDPQDSDGFSTSEVGLQDPREADGFSTSEVGLQDPREADGFSTSEVGLQDPREADGFSTSEVGLQDPREADGFSTSEVGLQDPQDSDGFSTSEVGLQDPQDSDGFSTSEVGLQDPKEADGFSTSEVGLQDPQDSDGFSTSEVGLQDPRDSDGFSTSEVGLQDPRDSDGFSTSEVGLQDPKDSHGYSTNTAEDGKEYEEVIPYYVEASDNVENKSPISDKVTFNKPEDVFSKKLYQLETRDDYFLIGGQNIDYDRTKEINANRLNAFNTSLEKSVIRTTQYFKGYDVGNIDVNYSFLTSDTKVIRILHDFQELKAFEVNVEPSYIPESIAQYNVNEFFVEIGTDNRSNFVPAQTRFETTETVIVHSKQKTKDTYNLINEPLVDIKDVVKDVVNTNYYDVLKEVSPSTSFQKNAVEYVAIKARKDWRRSPFYNDWRKRHIIPNTNYELFNGIGQVYNPFSIVFDKKPRIYKSDYFDSPNTGQVKNTLWLRFVTKAYDISKERLHGRPYEHFHDSGTEQEKWTSGRTKYDNHITGGDKFRWKGSNAFGHVKPQSLRRMTPYNDIKSQYVVQRKHYHTAYVEEYQTVNGIMPGYVVEFEDIEHNLTGKKNSITAWERLWHPDWTEDKINWQFEIKFGRLPNCLVFDGKNYIAGLVTDYDRFLQTYQDEPWFEYYGMTVDDNYKDFDIAPITEGRPENPDLDDPRKHGMQFSGFYPRQNYTKVVHLAFFILNNWSYDRDRFLLNHEEQLYFEGKKVSGKEYIEKMKEIGFFEYKPFQDGSSSINTNSQFVKKTLIHEIIDPKKQMIGCTIGETPEEKETIRKLFWLDNYQVPSPAATFRSCCPVNKLVSGSN